MKPRHQAGKLCTFCSFRQHGYQARRFRSEVTKRFDFDPKIRYTAHGADKCFFQVQDIAGTDGTVRKYLCNKPSHALLEPGRKERDQSQGHKDVIKAALEVVKEELKDAPIWEHVGKEGGGSFSQTWRTFTRRIILPRAVFYDHKAEVDQNLEQDLRSAYRQAGAQGLHERLKYAFYAQVTGARFTQSDIKNQKTLADLRYPSEWFPATRTLQRTIHLHVGPTNSGKTYHALQRLEQADTGVYAGPLRLLAHEVYTRLNAKGKRCSLVTGEERRAPDDDPADFGDMSSCTVEMIPLNRTMDVAVIDEIQMLGNADRGWAWTQALLGVKAKEVHLCGEERTVPLVRELCASVGEKLIIHKYERLSPLRMMDQSLDGDLKKLRKGDCIVSFSVMGIHALRRQVERATGRKVATVYGSLPPETRAQQARLFNDQTNDYDFLVASDAIGMGLNLSIKRIIFEATSKYDGTSRRTLGVADIKQIAGRAGRYRTAAQVAQEPAAEQSISAVKGDPVVDEASAIKERETDSALSTDAQATQTPVAKPPYDSENVGFVTTLEKFDFPVVDAAMKGDPEPIRTAGLFPPGPVLERFASYFPPGTPYSYIVTRLHELSMMHHRFHLCGLRDQLWIADLIEPVRGLTVTDRYMITAAPASRTDKELWQTLLPALGRCIADQKGGSILELDELPLEILEDEVSANKHYLRKLESLHKGVVGYLWLSFRFAGIFTTRALARHIKELVEEKIAKALSQFSFSEASRRKIAAAREAIMMRNVNLDLLATTEDDTVAAQTAEGSDDNHHHDTELATELESQTSVTAGGDRFGGETDIEIDEELEIDEAALEDGHSDPSTSGKPSFSSFAKWRAAQDVRLEDDKSRLDKAPMTEHTMTTSELLPDFSGSTSNASATGDSAVASDDESVVSLEENDDHWPILDDINEAGLARSTVPESGKKEAPMSTQEALPNATEHQTSNSGSGKQASSAKWAEDQPELQDLLSEHLGTIDSKVKDSERRTSPPS